MKFKFDVLFYRAFSIACSNCLGKNFVIFAPMRELIDNPTLFGLELLHQ
jgi:hypothetical protein